MGGLPDLLIGDLFISQTNVAGNITGKDKYVLLHLSNGTADLIPGHVTDIHAVNEDLALLDVVVAADQIQNGGLARTSGTYKSHTLTGLNGKAYISQHIIFAVIGKPYIFKFDTSTNLRQCYRLFRIMDHRLLIQQGKNLLCRSHRRLEGRKLLCQFLDGLEEGVDILNENIHGTKADDTVQHAIAAAGDNDDQCQDGYQVDTGTENGKDHHFLVMSLVQVFTLITEILMFFLLAVEDLDHLHTGNILGQEGIQHRHLGLGDLIGFAGNALKHKGQNHNSRYHHKTIQCHGHVAIQHDDHQTNDLHHVAEQTHHNIGIQVVQGFYVVGHTGHDLTHRSQIEETHGQAFHMGEHLITDLVNDLLSRLLQDQILYTITDEQDDQNHHIHNGSLYDTLESQIHHLTGSKITGNVQVNGITNDDGLVQLHGSHHQHHQEAKQDLRHIGLSIRKHAHNGIAFIMNVGSFLFFLSKQTHSGSPPSSFNCFSNCCFTKMLW